MERRRESSMSMLPSGMDGGRKSSESYGKGVGLREWQRNATGTLARSMERPSERPPNESLPKSRPGTKNSIRPVTPDSKDEVEDGSVSGIGSTRQGGTDIPSVSVSPRSTTGADRRNGLVFQDSYNTDSLDVGRPSGPPVSLHSYQPRPRTRTLEEQPTRNRSASIAVPKTKHRAGSSFHDVEPRVEVSNPLGRPTSQLQKSNSVKGRRLVKKSSRSASPLPLTSDVPSIDSLPVPAAGDASKILLLMKTLCGRMRGEVEYQNVESGPWYTGICYIEDVKGSFMYEGDDRGPWHLTVASELRGARVRTINLKEKSGKCLEVTNPAFGLDLRIIPTVKAEFDLWLAALLCWQQIRTSAIPFNSPKSPPMGERRPSVQSIGSKQDAAGPSKEANIIKVAKILLWDRGVPTSPAAIVRRPLTRDLRVPSNRSWRRVSCILQDNGEFKLLMENDVTLLSVIQLSQLSRSAIQRLDKSVLDEEFCIAIFPQYTSTSTQLSIFGPVYIALETRILFEVWFCLLRSFSMPEIYGPQYFNEAQEFETPEASTNDMFRIEKTLGVRLVEAKIRKPSPATESTQLGKHPAKSDQDHSVGDYFAEVILDGEIRARTMTKLETRNPFWREDCEFQDLPSYLPKLSIMLKRIQHSEVGTHGFLSSSSIHIVDHPTEVVCGIVEIPVEKLERGKDTEAWYPILDDQEEQVGEMFLKLRHEELVVLLAKDYQEISELLHRFANGLTLQIAQAIPTNLRKLSEILMNIFQVSGHASEWLRSLVEDEIDGIQKEIPAPRRGYTRRHNSNESSVSEREQSVRDLSKSLHGEANLLFRGNSLLTQALDFHMRRLGKEYLEDVLGERILKINALNPDCEVDPSRLTQGDDIHKNWDQLTALTTEIWESIAGSAAKCPPELRQILKYIRAVAEDRYGNFLRTVAYTSVSGFLFLRFFCPALLNPKLFGLLKDHPPPKAQRALTLIAKSLQALANLSTFGQKEEWMEPMNKFINSHRQTLKTFIDDACSLPSERKTFALPASYSTPITILARLPPTSREGFPSLPYLIDHARNFSALVKLWLDSTILREQMELDGALRHFNQLCQNLQHRTNECLLKAENDRTMEQPMQWDDIVEGLELSTIQDPASNPPDINSPQWAEYNAGISMGQRIAPGSAGSGAKQGFWETFGKDSKYQKPHDLADSSQALPPARGQSTNSKQPRGFLNTLIGKGKELTPSKSAQKEPKETPNKEN
jgi:hypothetical protein